MDREEIFKIIEETGIIGVIRITDVNKLEKLIEALSEGGVKALEITMTTPNAINIIDQISDKLDNEFIVGAGTVLDSETAAQAIHAGAEFVVGPTLDKEMIEIAHRYDKIVIPGAFSPTEIKEAWDAGADAVKVFPAKNLGPGYLSNIHGPLPQIKLTPTGGVSTENAAKYIRNGAVFLGVGSALVEQDKLENNDWEGIQNRAEEFIQIVEDARE